MKADTELLPLTGLRFVAAFYVFLFHIHIRWPLAEVGFFKNVLDQGAIGMSVFFVLSGFILAYRYANSQVPLKIYLLNRFSRIYPIYVLAALVTLPWIGIDVNGATFTEIALQIGKILLMVISVVFVIQAWLPQIFSLWNNGASWSISVEVFCYLVFPLVFPLLNRLSLRQLGYIAGAASIAAAWPGLSAALFSSHVITIFYSLPIFRLPEFIVGVCSSIAVARGALQSRKTTAQMAAICVLLIYIGFAGPLLPVYVGHSWIVVPTVAIVTITLASGNGIIAQILGCRPMVWLGKVSYCFYSFQALIIFLLIDNHHLLVEKFPAFASNYLLTMLSCIVLIIVSGLAFHFVEKPSRRWLKKKSTINLV